MTTASLLRRLLPCSPPAPQLGGKDPLVFRPSFLPRASVVCSCLRLLLSDPQFLRCFRIRHRRGPPLLGFFIDDRGDDDDDDDDDGDGGDDDDDDDGDGGDDDDDDGDGGDDDDDDGYSVTFDPAPGAPHRLPRGFFSLELGDSYMTLGWRHGLGLFFLRIRFEVLVWDPVAGHRHLLVVPPDFESHGANSDVSGAVLRAAGDVHHFRVVLVGSNGKQPRTMLACVYSSETGVWGDCVSAPLPSEGFFIFRPQPAVLAGNCLHWSFTVAGSRSILKFDLDRQSLAMNLLPGDYYTPLSPVDFMVMRAEGGGGMGFLFLYGFTAELWSLKPNRDGVEIWTPGRSIELDKLLRLNPQKDRPQTIGYAEENDVVFFWTVAGVFMVHLDSLQFKKLPKTSIDSWYHPFEIDYTPGIGGEHNGAKVVSHWWMTRWAQYTKQLFS